MVDQWLVAQDNSAEEGNGHEKNLAEAEHQVLEEDPWKYGQMNWRMMTAFQALEEGEAVVVHYD